MSIAHEGDIHKMPYHHWGISGYPMPEDTPYITQEDSTYFAPSSDLLEAIEKSINGEYHAIRRYSRMLELAPSPALQAILKEVRRDEKKHFHRFTSIYSAWTGGRQVSLHKNRVPTSFEEGVKDSIVEEQNDVKFYRGIAEMTRLPYIQRSYLDASHDERRHANWFIYMDHLLNVRIEGSEGNSGTEG